MENFSRRQLIAFGAGAVAGLHAQSPAPLKICVFSKHLQWLSVPDAAALAAEIGFDGLDITVREGGHVAPDRVADDLPRAVETVRKIGLDVPMITTDIVDVKTPHTEAILRVAGQLNVRHYRWGGLKLVDGPTVPEQIRECQARVRDLAALNKQNGVCAMYHTHSGVGVIGASIWDLYLILKDLDTTAAGVNYDIGHATVEGGLGGWVNSANLTLRMMRGVALKDFYWARTAKGKWEPQWCPIGEGMVRFPEFFALLRKGKFSGPVQLHCEYPAMGGADKGKRELTIDRTTFVRIVRRDLDRVREMSRAVGQVGDSRGPAPRA